MKKKTGDAGKNLIKQFEGFRAEAYLCPAGVMTIGYGTTKIKGHKVKEGMKITSEEADVFLEEDLKTFEDVVNRLVLVDLTQNQFDALVSFVYNLGPSNFEKSTLLKKVNAKAFDVAAEEFLKWDKAGGNRLPGLTRRRKAERVLFLT